MSSRVSSIRRNSPTPVPEAKSGSAVQAILFDMDGVLVRSNPGHLAAWRELAGRLGVQLSEAELAYGASGRRGPEIAEVLFGPAAAEACRGWAADKEACFRERARAQGLPAMPGVARAVADLQSAGYRLAVATSAPRENLELTLALLGLESAFATTVSAEQVRLGKPDPEVYLTAGERLGVAAHNCCVVEDAAAGIEAGRRAGMRTLGVAESAEQEAILLRAGAERVISDFTPAALEGLSFPAWLARFMR